MLLIFFTNFLAKLPESWNCFLILEENGEDRSIP